MIIRKTEKYMVDGFGSVTVHTAIDSSEFAGQPRLAFCWRLLDSDVFRFRFERAI
jgi:hypothetical protein